MTELDKALTCLNLISPITLNYEDWFEVGVVLKNVGASCNDWDSWSKQDKRYIKGECERKWKTISQQGNWSIGKLCKLVLDSGHKLPFKSDFENYSKPSGYELDWESEIGTDKIIDTTWLEISEVPEMRVGTSPKKEIIDYLTTLFELDDYVGYVTSSWHNKEADKHFPTKGCYDRTCKQLIDALNNAKTIQDVFGDYEKEVGAWIRFNPFDGQGVKDENITAYRYALVESDTIDLEKQFTMLKKFELPIKIMVHSGKKSLHAIVDIGATNYTEYKKRVDFLYSFLEKNSYTVDKQNKNPSRLSRMPGVKRGENIQYIVAKNLGKANWQEWFDWVQELNDELPEIENSLDKLNNLPEKNKVLIDNVLLQGHKMLLAGASKAGKSFKLIQLAIAIAEGTKWLGWQCAQGKVLYINLEVDKNSFIHRLKDVYEALGLPPKNASNLDIWNLRGNTAPLDKLTPKLIHRAVKAGYTAIIIDPIYKVITGDENSAEQMAKFCNQFDKICLALKCAVIYCHHHSKGSQGLKKSSDRSSGSGVFARDPDAILDLIELVIDEPRRKAIENHVLCQQIKKYMGIKHPDYTISSDDYSVVAKDLIADCERFFQKPNADFVNCIYEARLRAERMTAWQIEGTLREFPSFPIKKCFFEYPIHSDHAGLLTDAYPEGIVPVLSLEKKKEKKKESEKDKKQDRRLNIQNAYDAVYIDGEPTHIKSLVEYLNVSERTLRRWIGEDGDYKVISNYVSLVDDTFVDEEGKPPF